MEDNEDIPEILIPEVEKAIRSQKTEKAPRPDKITNELMRGTIKELSPILTKMFNETLNTGFIPSQWAESHIILLHKKGPKDDIGNYRPISLISNIYKVFCKSNFGQNISQARRKSTSGASRIQKRLQYD
ncbi:Probable RNA-directed DNA polymerase from transposon X-element [Eumeta japonica]|uniref:Probable RNA-directed DNA polymerase from transposon X-element n=1 Tax=Eumeta variegata TaxID=151549 RepID=A0A4C1ZLY7_EUMVA|nr:Probable RNA-directed DNA polymerase from transposon X-element [Eumeta japonica]